MAANLVAVLIERDADQMYVVVDSARLFRKVSDQPQASTAHASPFFDRAIGILRGIDSYETKVAFGLFNNLSVLKLREFQMKDNPIPIYPGRRVRQQRRYLEPVRLPAV